jgi:protein-L-isoaspartate(D-aspartate) O-methyltransferase
VLEIGAGTGYNAALMAHMVGAAGRVVTMDIDEDLVESARRHLAAVGVDNVLVVCADGGYGYAGAAPYDRIILTVGVSDISPHWWAQLKPNGRIVLPLEIGAGQKSVAFDWRGDCLRSNSVRECAFIKLRGEFAEMQMNLLPVGPVAGLDLIPSERATELPHSEDIYAWLMQPHATWSTGVRIAPHEYYGGLELWLSLHEPDMHVLMASGEVAERNIVPVLASFRDDRLYVSTRILCDREGMAALVRASAQQGAASERNNGAFDLYVRQFGAADMLAQRLVEQIQAWDAAGRPTLADLSIRVYPKDVSYIPQPGEYLLEKPWTLLVLDWHGESGHRHATRG